MGFEVIYKFYDRDSEGGYNKSEEKQLKKKIGDPFEEVPLEKLVSAIMSQMARRDILIFDVDIWELKKSKVSFKETKGGIVVKNKKFMLDDESNIVVQEIKEESLPIPKNGMVVSTPTIPNGNNLIVTNTSRPIKWVTLDPDEPNLAKIRGSGLAFLPDKRYPVFNEVAHPKQLGVMIYTMLDENKREVTVMDNYFVNADQRLQRGFSSTVDKEAVPKLSYDNYAEMEVPDIRAKR